MAKKVYDIIPPHLAKLAQKAKHIEAGKPEKRKPSRRAAHRKSALPSAKIPWKTGALAAVIVIFAAGGWFAVFKLPKADIAVWPKTEVLSLQEKITADASAAEIDEKKNIIPAIIIEEQQEGWQEFEATGTGSDSKKATGTVTLYNKITPSSPLTLKVGTHLLSDSGKYFLTLSRVTIPAMSGKKPGSATVRVEAQEAGQEHNIGPSKFSIPRLAGTSYYYTIWAESSGDMAGGTSSTFKRVTQADIDNAKAQLTQKLFGQAEQLLRKKIGEDDVLLNGAVSQSVESASADVKAGETANTFREIAKVKVSALVFKKSDVKKMAQYKLEEALPQSKKIIENTINATYEPDLIDMANRTGRLNLVLSSTIHQEINTNEIMQMSVQKSASQIQEIVSEAHKEAIDKITVSFWPFWVKKAPADTQRVKVRLEFD